jgi:hypothetical protein
MGDTYRSGVAAIKVDDSSLIGHIDRVSEGAATTFLRRSREVLEGIEADASTRWPVRSGASAAGFRVQHQVTGDSIEQSLVNREDYAGHIRWSVRTEASLDREATRVAARGDTPAARDAIHDYWRGRLTRSHGKGAPTERLAGRKPWATLINAPGKKAAKALVSDLRDELQKLAGAT